MNNNYEIIRTIFENNLQKIVECKDSKTGNVYINNTIINQKLIKLINIEKLKTSNLNIVECYKTEDRLYIVTKPLDNIALKLKDYINSRKLSLKQQFLLTEELLKIAVQFYDCSDLLQHKIINFDSIYVTPDNDIIADAYFEFYEEYDISDNYTFKSLGNMIHYIFSGKEITDYNISDALPPDIMKLTVKCMTKEYRNPKDALDELLKSPIYNLVNCKPDTNAVLHKSKNDIPAVIIDDDTLCIDNNESELREENKHSELVNDTTDNEKNVAGDVKPIIEDDIEKPVADDINKQAELDEDTNVIDIYLSDTEVEQKKRRPDKKIRSRRTERKAVESKPNNYRYESSKESKDKSKKKSFKPALIAVGLVVILGLGSFVWAKTGHNNGQQVANNNVPNVESNEQNVNGQLLNNSIDSNNQTTTDNQQPVNDGQATDQFYFADYFNKDILSEIGYSGKIAVVDTENFYDNNKSLLIDNTSNESTKGLFAVIDFNSDNYNYMKNRQVGVSAKFKSENDLEAVIVIEAYKDGKIVANNSGKVQVYNDVWSMKQITINIGDIDRVQLYLEFNEPNKIWIDSIGVDVLK